MDNPIQDKNCTKKPDSFWLRPPDERRCTAHSKQSGQRCKRYASPGKRVCKFHGGRSTGPVQPAVKHGLYALEVLKEKAAEKVKQATEKEKFCFQYDFSAWVTYRLERMSYQEFRRVRPALAAFVQGNLSARRLAAVVEGKPYNHEGRKSSCSD